MARKSSSGRWKQRQMRDPFVRQAQSGGWRSRAVFKLQEIDARERLLRKGATVVDLGAAPGGWSQLAAEKVGPTGRVVAVDLLEMEPLAGVEVIQGDLTAAEVQADVLAALGGAPADVVLSDMAPNITGHWSVDGPRAMELAGSVLDACATLLRPGGSLVIKLFQAEGFELFVKEARRHFAAVRMRKPPASRAESREMYLVAADFRLV